MLAHTELGSVQFPFSSTELVVAGEFTRTEMSIESYADLVGASSTSIRKTERAIAKEVNETPCESKETAQARTWTEKVSASATGLREI